MNYFWWENMANSSCPFVPFSDSLHTSLKCFIFGWRVNYYQPWLICKQPFLVISWCYMHMRWVRQRIVCIVVTYIWTIRNFSWGVTSFLQVAANEVFPHVPCTMCYWTKFISKILVPVQRHNGCLKGNCMRISCFGFVMEFIRVE